MCILPPVRPRFHVTYFVAVAGLALLATSCSSPAATTATTTGSRLVKVKTTTNEGLCKLVSPSVVATTESVSMTFPVTVTHGSTTECEYRAKQEAAEAVLIRYDTDASASTFSESKSEFQNRGLKVGPISGLGEKAYYFTVSAGQTGVTTVVVLQGSLQLLTTGVGTVDQIGAIARYALNQYESTPSSR